MRSEKKSKICVAERHEAFEVFIDLFMPITCCLEEIANSSPADWNSETRSDAQSFFLTTFRFSFVVSQRKFCHMSKGFLLSFKVAMLMLSVLTRTLKLSSPLWLSLGQTLKIFMGKLMEKFYCYAKV